MANKIVLLLAANPKSLATLQLEAEKRDIIERLRIAGYGKYSICSASAVRPMDIHQAMLDFNPQIVHFSGHGAGIDGLAFEDNSGHEKLVDGTALADLFELFSDKVECVVLNACYSEIQAKAISKNIDYVIGMRNEIGDKAARAFSVGFYTALGANQPYEFAYKMGCNAINLEKLADYLSPVLLKRNKDTVFKPDLPITLKNNTYPEMISIDRQWAGEKPMLISKILDFLLGER